MKILIAADMEGITGVVHWDHVTSTHAEYARFRPLMTGDVNAAIRGAFDGGADEVIVTDGHGNGRNIMIEALDPRARLNSGGTRPFSMVQSVETGVDAAMFIGYHARAGTPNAILDHVWTGGVHNVWLNGVPVGEIGLNAAVCGHFGVPVIALSGCAAACAEAQALLGEIETAPVKWASGRMGAECLPPAVSQAAIYEAARRAVQRLAQGQSPEPLVVRTPVELAVEFNTSEMADGAALLPEARRDGRTLTFVAPDMVTAYRLFRAATALA